MVYKQVKSSSAEGRKKQPSSQSINCPVIVTREPNDL